MNKPFEPSRPNFQKKHGRRPVRVSLETAAPPVFGKEGYERLRRPSFEGLFDPMTEANCVTGTFDAFNRRVNYLRISVTDRCNLRCTYCSDGEINHLHHDDILRYEEIERVTKAAAALGVRHVRLSGGEPLVRPYLWNLIELLTPIPGIEDISLTTNGTLLKEQATKLRSAGLKRINVSLDSLRPGRFERITGGDKLGDVLEGIQEAHRVGLSPVKINMVVIPGVNDDEVEDFALMAKDEGWHVRFIEHMPFGGIGSTPSMTVAEIKEKIESMVSDLWPCCLSGAGPASYFSFGEGQGTIGFIRPVSHRFCGQCNRLRLTADGKLRPCLLNDLEIDIKSALRNGAGISDLKDLLKQAIIAKPERHHLETAGIGGRQMRQIGG
ncbi:cyclic pyranopterin monophosphate synthase subunit MoaA [Dehalogenimonas alkenigignens]|uniref:GTP 3',8-cyclase n=2 Tax=Dehalogenimonas alkenigignens TaxID=1217799 RepID=A0A0W0GIT7_9CHLR|nr:cyclic pyranopterin monophosphate synthase subunit MoaA [Dehalogenimonas alkenigignens]